MRVHQDAGRSGLTIERGPGLTALLDDIRGGRAGFDGVLVLDVTRWGRFQNTAEGAFHEFLFWRSDVQIIDVDEPSRTI